MTTKDLIEKLKQYPEDTKVEFSYCDDGEYWVEFLEMNLRYLEASKVLDFEIFP